MTDIENAAEIIPRKLSLLSITNEDRSRTASIIDNFAVDLHTSISSDIPIITNETDKNDENISLFPNRKIYKNLIILSLAFVLMFVAYLGILSLQSSLNTKGNVGVNSLIVVNIFILTSSIFFTGISTDIFGLKGSMIIGMISFILFMGANIRPIPMFMYPTAALVGLASAPLWVSQVIYTSHIARYHAYHKQKKVADIISLFFGIFFAIFGTASIWGNLVSYIILNQSNHTHKSNCGIYFDPLLNRDTDHSSGVSDLTRYVLCGVYAGLVIVSMILLIFFLDQIPLAKSR